MLISIIIPIYNTPEKILKRCLDSIDCYNDDTVEVILVDDGSLPDNSKYYEDIAKEYNNIRYIHQENRGVSAARNVGITIANGMYIIFVDADDTVFKEFINSVVCLIKERYPDIIIGKIDFDGGSIKQNIDREYFFENSNIVEAEKALTIGEYEKNGLNIPGSPCGRAYKKGLIENILFDEEVNYFEDQLFNIRAFHASNSILVVPQKWYKYHQNDFSAMHKAVKSNYAFKSIPFLCKLYNLIRDDSYIQISDELAILGLNFIYNAYTKLYMGDFGVNKIFTTETKMEELELVRYLKNKRTLGKKFNMKIYIKLIILRHSFLRNNIFKFIKRSINLKGETRK